MYRCPFKEQPQVPDMAGGTSPLMEDISLQNKGRDLMILNMRYVKHEEHVCLGSQVA
jgi:hypothetical protein